MPETVMNATKEQIKAALEVVFMIGEAIREAKEVPSGKLYAVLMSATDLAGFNKAVDMLVGAGVVERAPNNLLRWVGPTDQKSALAAGKSCGTCRHMAAMSGAADHWCVKVSATVKSGDLLCGGVDYVKKPETVRESRRYA